ncbi:hypothetical protein HOK00_00885 [bacterium]|jgi:hypothetical protein|nr:hypothetical protein [bacterium]
MITEKFEDISSEVVITDDERYLKSALITYFTGLSFFLPAIIAFLLEVEPVSLFFLIILTTIFGNTSSILLIGLLIQRETTQTDKESPVKVVLNKIDTMYWVLKRFQMEQETKMLREEQEILNLEIPFLLKESKSEKGKEIQISIGE